VNKENKDATAIFATLAKVAKTWVNPQVRNVATLGGHIGWGHPCSDFIPIFMASGCSLEVQGSCGTKKNIPMDEKFWGEPFKPAAVKAGDLILGVKVPFSKAGERCGYYRRARRKEFDLPVANAAFFGHAIWHGPGGVIQGEPRVVAGGAEGAFPGAKVSPATFLSSTSAYLKGRSVGNLNKKDLAKAVFSDVHVEERAPGQFSNYRRCLVAVFAERFLQDLTNGGSERGVGEKREPMSSHQLFQSVDKDQPKEDALTRPMQHNWAA